MSTADVALAVDAGVCYLATLGAVTYLAKPLIDRLRVTGQPIVQVIPGSAPVPQAGMQAPDASGRIPARKSDVEHRQQQFNEHREAGLSVKEAGLAIGVKERTALDYETRRLAQNPVATA